MKKLLESIEYSEDWLMQEIFRTFEKEKETGKKEVIKISKIDLLRLVQRFVRLNRGE